jgi:hypothetical protein
MAKARGFTISIEKMSEKDRGRSPTAEFGEDYNKLRAAVRTKLPQLADLLPPEVATFESANGSYYARCSYSELDSYCEQIYQLASECDDA